jgi:hypothetical protein
MKRKHDQENVIMTRDLNIKLITNTNLFPVTHFFWQEKINRINLIEIRNNKITNDFPFV